MTYKTFNRIETASILTALFNTKYVVLFFFSLPKILEVSWNSRQCGGLIGWSVLFNIAIIVHVLFEAWMSLLPAVNIRQLIVHIAVTLFSYYFHVWRNDESKSYVTYVTSYKVPYFADLLSIVTDTEGINQCVLR